jgi:2,3-bisphosphoglycerate-independent phosphoglycerate mutase
LLEARQVLVGSNLNRARARAGKHPLDVLTTKWSGVRQQLPSFSAKAGVAGGAITSSRLYRGFADLLGMTHAHRAPVSDVAADLATRLDLADQLICDGARFVHVHTKVTDEAGHTKRPTAKLEALEALDPGLEGLDQLAERAVVAITGDHATPSTGGVLHTADPTPLLVVGPTVRGDDVTQFGERYARAGWYGLVRATELLPMLFDAANRPTFLGHRPTPRHTLALPDCPEAMPII